VVVSLRVEVNLFDFLGGDQLEGDGLGGDQLEGDALGGDQLAGDALDETC
jgi:hypothetical protein